MLTEEHYRVVFDFPDKGFQWWFPCIGFAPLAVGLAHISIAKWKNWSFRKRVFGFFMTSFALLWLGLVFWLTGSEYLRAKSAFESRTYSVAEGPVTDFRPMPYQGHQDECFTVQSASFCYSDYTVTAGFNNSASHGGPIREGLPVR